MKILLDGFGGDNAPLEMVKGAVDAIKSECGFTVVICGKEDDLKVELKKYKYDSSRIELLPASEVITNDDVPTSAIKNKKDSSMVVALNALKENADMVALISAGSTGAVLAGSLFIVGRIEGIKRPALAPVLPTIDGRYSLLIDCGANVDCKAEWLVQFAIMGSRYMTAVYGIDKPRVGLLSNGTEDKKGNELNRETFPLLQAEKSINFIGNIEARDNLSGVVDVIVTDGFAGNVALKASEGVSSVIFAALRQEVENSFKAKIGMLFMKKSLRRLKKRLDYNQLGGAPFLGVQKIVIKAHGSSKAAAICNSILQAKMMYEADMIEKIRASLVVQEV